MPRLTFALILYSFATACSSDAAAPDGAVADAGTPDSGPSAKLLRGQYLVDSVMACGDCHTPRDKQAGAPIAEKYLSGVECLLDFDPGADGVGCLHSRNLTSDATGLKNFTDAQVKDMFTKGILPGGQGKFLSPIMPYWVGHLLADADADAIVAYLRTVPPVSHTVPGNQPPFDNIQTQARLLEDSEIPTAAAGQQAGKSNGRYLAAVVCLECHTPELPPGMDRPVDVTRAFQGGRDFPSAVLGLPPGVFPDHIFSANLTPDATGLAGWSAGDVVRTLHQGLDKDGKLLCPPMPFGPMGAFAGITDGDATDIANYLLNLPAAQTEVHDVCFAPGQ